MLIICCMDMSTDIVLYRNFQHDIYTYISGDTDTGIDKTI